MATPAEVRKLLKQHRLPFDVKKEEKCWFVTGAEPKLWRETSLNVYNFRDFSTQEVVDEIIDLAQENRKLVLQALEALEQDWKKDVLDSINQVDLYINWRDKNVG